MNCDTCGQEIKVETNADQLIAQSENYCPDCGQRK